MIPLRSEPRLSIARVAGSESAALSLYLRRANPSVCQKNLPGVALFPDTRDLGRFRVSERNRRRER